MASEAEVELRAMTKADLPQAWLLDQQAFNSPDSMREGWLRFMMPDRMHGVFLDGSLAAMSAALPYGQYFGGRRVSMGGLSSVAVRAESRGAGHGSRAVVGSLRGMRERGEAISALFPGTTSLYRGLGWELAGAYVRWQVAPASLLALERPAAGRVRRAELEDLPRIKAFYEGQAQSINGHLDRSQWGWLRLEKGWKEHLVYLALAADGEIEGYVVYRHGASPPAGGDFPIHVTEVVARTRQATSSLWWLIGSSASQVDQVTYTGSPEDSLALLLPEQKSQETATIRWMLRLVDVEQAVSERGYSPALALEVPITLRDEQIPENAGDWIVTVSKGAGQLEPGGTGGVRLGIGAFSALYSGWASMARLQQAGLIEAGTADQRAKLDGAFAGPTPWMPEEF